MIRVESTIAAEGLNLNYYVLWGYEGVRDKINTAGEMQVLFLIRMNCGNGV
jgi:hypothetical protein